MLGYLVVSANTEVKIEDNIIDRQNEQIEYLKSYGYTLDNPNVILNPYDISPLTALIIFETNDAVPVSITVVGKNSDSSYTKHFEKSKVHYIPVYGLYADYNNKIIIKCQNTEKVVEIKTEKLPKDMLIDLNNNGKRDCEVKKTVLEDIEEVQCLEVGPNLIIRTHKHIEEWEVWIWPSRGQAYICPKGGQHALLNTSNTKMNLIAIKGKKDYAYEELAVAFRNLGFKVSKGDLQN